MSESGGVPAPAEFDVSAGPTISFGFNLGKIPDQGEDSDPILRDGPDLGLVGVFDGMGGAGGTVYETPDGRRSGAYLASRIARDVVERRMVDLLEPDWNLKGEAAAEDLRRSVQDALQERLAELKAPPSQLRSRLLRALPTTMAVVALQRTHRDRSRWTCHVFWAGDSRAYAFLPTGLRQLSTDDLRDPSDAMTNLYRDSVVSNAMSADTEFHVNYRRVELKAPFLVCCATDGCFGYVPSPMHFEHLVLGSLQESRSVDAWSRSIQAQVSAVTGDDAAMAMMSIGAGMPELKSLYAPRVAELEEHYLGPLDESRRAVAEAERALEAARQRHSDLTGERWAAYQPDYERHLKPDSPLEDEQPENEQGDNDQPGDEQAVEESEPAEESESAEEKVTS